VSCLCHLINHCSKQHISLSHAFSLCPTASQSGALCPARGRSISPKNANCFKRSNLKGQDLDPQSKRKTAAALACTYSFRGCIESSFVDTRHLITFCRPQFRDPLGSKRGKPTSGGAADENFNRLNTTTACHAVVMHLIVFFLVLILGGCAIQQVDGIKNPFSGLAEKVQKVHSEFCFYFSIEFFVRTNPIVHSDEIW
jgi:hypothetical protein